MLEEIVRYKVEETRQRARMLPKAQLDLRLALARPVRDFAAALSASGTGLIAEVKYRSPSKGILRVDFEPLALARAYQAGGADAISVLADSRFFGGGPFVVAQVARDDQLCLPVMYKDFVVDDWQVVEARALGADAVLLIARIVPPDDLRRLVASVHALGMTALVETFDEDDVRAAVDSGARVIGINNRDLNTFETDFNRAARMRKLLPEGVIAVSESGITGPKDMATIGSLGFDAALVGEAVVSAPSPERAVAQLKGR